MTGPRIAWADTAKGACIVLVVLWHVTRKDYLPLPWEVQGPVVGAWGELSVLLLPVRMPLFFLVSGLVAGPLLQRPWRRVLGHRVAPVLYLFVLWTLVHTVVLRATPGFETAVAHGPLELLTGLTITPGNLWYLEALALYVVVARATRAHPDVTLVAAALLSAVASAQLVPTPGNRYGLLANLVFFLVGLRFRDRSLPDRRVMLGVTFAFVLGAGVWQLRLVDQSLFGFRPLLGLLGLGAGATVALWLSSVPRVGDALATLGRQTLPIYVLHLPLVALAHLATTHLVVGRLAGSTVLATAYPALLTAVVVAVCLGLHRAMLRVRAGWLFTAPWVLRARDVAPAESRGRRLPA